MHLAVFGASGRTGVPLVEQALARGHEVVAFVRDPDRFPVDDERLQVVVGDAYTGDGLDEAVAPDGTPVDAVVSVLGQGRDTPSDLVAVAGGHVMDAMERHGVRRLVTLTGAGVRVEGEAVSLAGRAMGGLLKLVSRAVLEDATAHVEDVTARDLDWTVVRVPRLTDAEPTGNYRAGDIALGFESVSRADVATFMLDCLRDDAHVRDLPKVGAA